MKSPLLGALLATVFSFGGAVQLRAQGAAFTYQGRLNDSTNAVNGRYDLRFILYTAEIGGSQRGPILTNTATLVNNGLFTATLEFGNVFDGAAYWLEIAVRMNGAGAFTTLSPRQQLTSTPYAIRAAAAAAFTGAVSDSQLSANVARLNSNQVFTGVVVFSNAADMFTGKFTGNGAGVTNVNFETLNSFGIIQWPGNFVINSSPTVGRFPASVAAADVNGDGKADLISANDLANTLTVLTNNGSGGFVSNASYAVGFRPVSVVAADVNGDGKLDLISANNFADTLTVLTNAGSGGFVLASSPAVGNGPQSVVAADVNGDGKLDLISANYFTNTLTVLTNNGSGGFVSNASYTVGTNPVSVAAADVNGDGKVDLISANYANLGSGDTLTVLTNNGSGGFVLASSPAVGSGPFSVAAADVNSDGKVDLISANTDANTLTVLTNNGSGGFVLASLPAVGSGPRSVAATDVNGDGKVDLISANQSANTLTVLFNVPTSNGSFTGDGGGLTDLNAASVTGVLGTAQIPNLNASKITSGTLSDARLSANVALRAGGNAFTGDQTVTSGSVGIGTTSPESELHIFRGSYGGPTASPSSLLTLENNNTAIIQMLTPATNFSGIVFGIPTTNSLDASMRYNFLGERELVFRTLNSTRMVITTNGSVGIGTMAPGNRLHVNGGITCTALTQTSDRNAKENFAPVSPVEVLNKVAALPIATWNFKELNDGRHIGPMAQDFYAVFGLGRSETTITSVDPDGVALAAIQGLNQKLDEQVAAQKVELKAKGDRIAELERRLGALEELIQAKVEKRK